MQVITFDADDTLWDMGVRVQVGMTVLAQTLSPLLQQEAASIESALTAAVAHIWGTTNSQTLDYLQARRQAIGQILRGAGLSDDGLADEMLRVYLAARDADLFIFPDARDTLTALKRQYIIGWITNGTSLPHEVGLQDYFDFAINWHTLGIRKPRPEIFEHAAALAGVDPSQILHIGDNLEADVAGIQGVGGIGVWYNYHQQVNSTRIVPHHEIHRLWDVVDVVAQL